MAPASPLRRRMIEDMTVRNLSPATQRSYLNAVSKFSRYFGRSPDHLGLEDVHAFQVHLVATGSCKLPSRLASWASLAVLLTSPIPPRSPSGSISSNGPTGSSTPSRHSAGPNRCWLISAAIRIASPSPTVG